jgi:hypothetical protein
MKPPALISTKLVIGGIAAVGVFAIGLGIGLNHAGSTTLNVAGAAATPSPSPNAGHKGTYGGRYGAGLGASVGALVKDISKETGKSPMEIVTAVRSGQTLDQVAGPHASTVKADAVAAVKTRLQSAVSEGVLTQTQANSLLNDATDAIDQIMGAKLGAGLSGKAGLGFGFGAGKHGHSATPSPSPSPAA